MIEAIIDGIIGWIMFFCVAIFGGIATLFFSGLDYLDNLGGNVEYTHIVKGKTLPSVCSGRDEDTTSYEEYILVKNMPKDYSEQNKTMIAYFDSAGPSIDDFRTKMPDIKDYDISFYKSTYDTRKYFIEAKKYWATPSKLKTSEDCRRMESISRDFGDSDDYPERYFGYMSMFRCDSDPTKVVVILNRRVEVSPDHFEYKGIILQNECGYSQNPSQRM